jgi:hypothetical protein
MNVQQAEEILFDLAQKDDADFTRDECALRDEALGVCHEEDMLRFDLAVLRREERGY